MASEAEKLAEELLDIVAPLEGAALRAVIAVVRALVLDPGGAELAAKRSLQALEAEAFIRS